MIQFGVNFSTLGVPETGLSPTITIRDTSDGSLEADGVAMTEVGGGAYKYNFTNDTAKRYCVVMDGGVDTLDSRYMTAWSERAKSEAEIDFLNNIEGGKWHITENQMIFYEDDNVTEVCRFNLFNKNDQAASTNVYRRERV